MTVDELQEEIAELGSHLHAGMCRWLELIAELDRRGDFTESGSGSCAEWLAWRCGVMPRTAREHVRVARSLAELPLLHGAFSRGELSYAKVRALTRTATSASEEELLSLARELTAAQLDRAVRSYRRVTNAEANALEANAHAGWHWDEDGSFVLQARLSPERGALFLRGLENSRDRLQEQSWEDEAGSAEPALIAPRPTNADALVAMAEASLTADGPGTSAERYQVVVHADAAALASEGEGGCALEDGPALAPETARRLSCDASVVEHGRRRRTPPASTRRALRTRDRGCRFPGCENRRFVDAHHVRHWARGGETTLSNLVLLCRRHHRFVHEGGYSVEAAGDHFRFRDPWGGFVPDVPRSPPGDAQRLLELETDDYDPGWNDPMDLELTVDAIAHALG